MPQISENASQFCAPGLISVSLATGTRVAVVCKGSLSSQNCTRRESHLARYHYLSSAEMGLLKEHRLAHRAARAQQNPHAVIPGIGSCPREDHHV